LITKVTPRSCKLTPFEILKQKFGSIIAMSGCAVGIYSDSSCKNVVGITGLPIKALVIQVLLVNG